MRSIYMRVFLLTLYTIALSSMVGFYIANLYYHWYLKSAHDHKLHTVALNIKAFLERHPDALEDYLIEVGELGYQMYVYELNGHESYYGGTFQTMDLSAEVIEFVMSGKTYHGIAKFPYQPFKIGYFDNRLSNSVGVSLTVEGKRLALFIRHDARMQFDVMRTFFFVMFAATILSSIPYFLLSSRYLVQPIISLTEATKRIAKGDYNLQLPTKRRDEIGQLAKHFHHMSRQLRRSDEAKKEFVANVSHEIHSPLTSIQGYADALLQNHRNHHEVYHYASVIGQEARHLARLTKQLLLLSSLDHTDSLSGKKRLPLKPQLRRALQLLEWTLTKKELSVRMRVSEQLLVSGDEVLLAQVWSNLLSNAVKHISHGQSIDIQAYQKENMCVVEITDTGDGIPEEQLPFIFDRFYRGDRSRSRNAGSAGLGLSIVQKIVHLHGGNIKVHSQKGKGTTFTIRLPDE